MYRSDRQDRCQIHGRIRAAVQWQWTDFSIVSTHRCVAATDACTRQLIGWMTQHSSYIEQKFWAFSEAIAEKCCDTR